MRTKAPKVAPAPKVAAALMGERVELFLNPVGLATTLGKARTDGLPPRFPDLGALFATRGRTPQ